MDISRRHFLKTTSTSLVLGAVASHGIMRPIATAAQSATELSGQTRHTEIRRGDMVYRLLGRMKERVSVIGLGGYNIGKLPAEGDSTRIVRTAVDRGITFMDNCWDYKNGTSEIRMGKALRDGYREKVFLMTKRRTKQAAAQQLDESLRRLQTDRIDLLQHHEVINGSAEGTVVKVRLPI